MNKSKNVTFNLPPDLIDKYKFYVRQNFIPSVNAGVREALEAYSKRLDKEMLKMEMSKAAKDSIFLKDLQESMQDFELLDEEEVQGDST